MELKRSAAVLNCMSIVMGGEVDGDGDGAGVTPNTGMGSQPGEPGSPACNTTRVATLASIIG